MPSPAGLKRSTPGWVYILKSRSTPGVLKIGRTNRDAKRRAQELERSADYGAFGPWCEVWSRDVSDTVYVETAIHRMLAAHRVRGMGTKSRELFNVEVGKACAVAIAVADSLHRPARQQPSRRRASTQLARPKMGRTSPRSKRRSSWTSRAVWLIGVGLLALWAFGS